MKQKLDWGKEKLEMRKSTEAQWKCPAGKRGSLEIHNHNDIVPNDDRDSKYRKYIYGFVCEYLNMCVCAYYTHTHTHPHTQYWLILS